MKIWESRSNTYQEFHFDKGEKINIYMCGPTVYDRVHIGNLRTFLFGDVFARTLRFMFGETNVRFVMNITDIDDKIIRKMTNNEPTSDIQKLFDVTKPNFDAFVQDLEILGCKLAEFHQVSDNMDSIIEFIQDLLAKGFAYTTNDGSVYFDTSKISEKHNRLFNRILNIDTTDNFQQRKIIKSKDVKNKNDFILWKSLNANSSNTNKFYWQSTKLSDGRPGWHIECSAIAEKYLDNVTFHLGGEDLKFPHHTNEILQCEARNPNVIFGKYWLHVSHLHIAVDEKAEKMSKSLGNVITIAALLDQGFHPKVLRFFLINKNYRAQHNFAHSLLLEHKIRLMEMHTAIAMAHTAIGNATGNAIGNATGNATDNISKCTELDLEFENKVVKHLKNDMQIDYALQELEQCMLRIRNSKSIDPIYASKIINTVKKLDQIFNIFVFDVFEIDTTIRNKIKMRDQLRKSKKFKEADQLRAEIQKTHYLADTPNGYVVWRNVFE